MSEVGETPGPTIPRIPIATYRFQFNSSFTFEDAERLVPYLNALGISHLYGSPYLKARSGSVHGYDITDHNALNPEVGSSETFEALVAALRQHGMGQIVDFVPNHMGVGKADNEWWLDVLEWGRASPFAAYFDINWEPTVPALTGKVLLPVLGDHYGRVLEAGELQLRFDAEQGSFSIWYHEHRFPATPRYYARIVALALEELERRRGSGDEAAHELGRLIAEFRQFRTGEISQRRRTAQRQSAAELKQALATLCARDPTVAACIARSVEIFNGTPGQPESFDRLHRLLELQPYRLAYWRVAADEINYRRFFDINDLAGLRMDLPDLFERTHRLIFRLLAEDKVHGLRIDHIDGLYDPEEYCRWLQRGYGELPGRAGPVEDGSGPSDRPLYLVVEKILAHHERLREEWPIAGTTGYEFTNLVNGLFVDSAGERPLDRIYRRFIGQRVVFDEVLYASKKHVMGSMLASELTVLATELNRISEANWRTRDFTLSGLRDVLKEVVACFPVYRTYVSGRGTSSEDRRDIDWAIAQARKRYEAPDSSIFDFVHEALTTDLVRTPRSGYSRRAVLRFAMKFQQYTGPVMAKGLEDTSFYRYNRLISLNEVGGDPRRFGVSLAAFHHVTQERARHWPTSMLATATHDTKRGEDVRTRIDVLSEIPDEWGHQVQRWARMNRHKKREIDGQACPTPNDEYLIYQTLLGAWPLELRDSEALDTDILASFQERCAGFMTKAMREAKQNTSWGSPNTPYEEAVTSFIRQILDATKPNPFLADFLPFHQRVATFGMLNSLSQTVLKLTVPGIPDIYQGCELWELSLVDPDNRRPVDYGHRIEALNRLRQRFSSENAFTAADAAALVDDWPDGRVKLYVIWRLLELRRTYPELFRTGAYRPLGTAGDCADNLCAFAREDGDVTLIVVVPRLLAGLANGTDGSGHVGVPWGNTAVACPPLANGRAFHAVFTGERLTATEAEGQQWLPCEALFASFPVAALVSAAAPSAE